MPVETVATVQNNDNVVIIPFRQAYWALGEVLVIIMSKQFLMLLEYVAEELLQGTFRCFPFLFLV